VFWAFLTGLYGDEIIKPLFTLTAQYGFDEACERMFSIKSKNCRNSGELDQKILRRTDQRPQRGPCWTALISKKTGAHQHRSGAKPGWKVCHFPFREKPVHYDLFLASAANGRSSGRCTATRDGHIDELDYIESAAPVARQQAFAFTGVAKGDNILIIKEALTGKTVEEFFIKGVLPSTTLPGRPTARAWSFRAW